MFRCFFAFLFSPLLSLCFTAATRAEDTTAPVKQTLPNGLRIVCKQETDTPLIAIDVFVRAGAAQETAGSAGLGSFVAHTLFASTTNSPPDTVARDINALGGNVSATWHADWTQVAVLTVKDKFPDAVFLLSDTLKNADFDPEVVKTTRDDILSNINDRDSDLFQTAYLNLQRALYAGTTYALPAEGTMGSVNRLTHDDLRNYYNRYYVPQNMVMVVVGNITPEAALHEIIADLSDFPRVGRSTVSPTDPLPPLTQDLPPVRVYQPDLEEDCVVVGFRAAPVSDPDYPALLVANALLGGMKTSRMFTQLREKQGLAYELGSLYDPQLNAGALAAYVFGAPTKTDPTTKKSVPTIGLIKEGILQQIESLKTTPPTAPELARAQHFLIGSYNLKHERLEDRATLLGNAELSAKDGYKLDTDYARYINAVTLADVKRVAAKYFVHPVISTVEPDTKDAGVVSR